MRVSKFLNLCKVEFDGCLTSEHCHDNFDFLAFRADRFDNADEVFECAVDDSDVVADFDVEVFDTDRFKSDSSDFVIGKRNRTTCRANKTRNPACSCHHKPDMVGVDHFDENVAREFLR